MILRKGPQQRRIRTIILHISHHRHQIRDAPAGGLKRANQRVVDWEVQHPVDRALVSACVAAVAGVDFADGVDAGGGAEGGPEAFFDVFDGVDAEAVDCAGLVWGEERFGGGGG